MDSSEHEILAPAKINLILRVGGKRADGYHDIETVMQKIELADRLTLTRLGGSGLVGKLGGPHIILRCPGADLPEDKENLVFKAALAFFDYTGLATGVRMTLEKRIPTAAGLGGGSSDAAATLLGLNRLFGADLAADDLLGLAASLGADVPFFVSRKAAAYATGTGTTLNDIDPVTDCFIVLVNPGVSVSTKWVYDNFRLTTAAKQYMLTGYPKSLVYDRCSAGNDLPAGMAAMLAICGVDFPFNDLETVTAQRYGVIQTIKDELMGQGACLAMMSGSGSTVYGIFKQRSEAEASYSSFKKLYGGVFLTRPVVA